MRTPSRDQPRRTGGHSGRCKYKPIDMSGGSQSRRAQRAPTGRKRFARAAECRPPGASKPGAATRGSRRHGEWRAPPPLRRAARAAGVTDTAGSLCGLLELGLHLGPRALDRVLAVGVDEVPRDEAHREDRRQGAGRLCLVAGHGCRGRARPGAGVQSGGAACAARRPAALLRAGGRRAGGAASAVWVWWGGTVGCHASTDARRGSLGGGGARQPAWCGAALAGQQPCRLAPSDGFRRFVAPATQILRGVCITLSVGCTLGRTSLELRAGLSDFGHGRCLGAPGYRGLRLCKEDLIALATMAHTTRGAIARRQRAQ
ncbi:MAG: hypothetical protein J3K34DRAFT_58308 [Monoraphidium minutum]|nr:MAG: hypothetical protein J3K34DRAFT_58308 [Monoraphidium minutum]